MKRRDFHKKRKELNFLIIISVLSLILLAASPVHGSNLNYPSFSKIGPVLEPIPASPLEDPEFSELVLISDEESGSFQKIQENINIIYTLIGIGQQL